MYHNRKPMRKSNDRMEKYKNDIHSLGVTDANQVLRLNKQTNKYINTHIHVHICVYKYIFNQYTPNHYFNKNKEYNNQTMFKYLSIALIVKSNKKCDKETNKKLEKHTEN